MGWALDWDGKVSKFVALAIIIVIELIINGRMDSMVSTKMMLDDGFLGFVFWFGASARGIITMVKQNWKGMLLYRQQCKMKI